MSFINPITDLNLTDSIDSSYRSAISKDNGVLKDYFTNFLTNIQIKIESGQSVNFTIEESEFLMNLLTNIIDNGILNGDESTEIESDWIMANIDYYANQYNESKKALRQIYWDIAQKIIKNHNHQNKIHAVKNHNQITILDNQSEIPLISTDIPFGFAKDGEQIFTENFTYQMNKALKLIEEWLQLKERKYNNLWF